jgi:RNA polymerase sigma-70 factor (ECF subfamily)
MTDSQLIRLIKEGDINLYSELILRYEKKLAYFIANILKGTQISEYAEDICQEAFYKAYRSLHTFRDEEATFSTWLYTIARNTALSELRRVQTVEVSLDDMLSSVQVSNLLLPEQELLRNERVNKVREAINELPEKQRTAIILREYEQMEYNEIAQVLGQSVSAVKSLLFRARSGIKYKLEDYEGVKG